MCKWELFLRNNISVCPGTGKVKLYWNKVDQIRKDKDVTSFLNLNLKYR